MDEKLQKKLRIKEGQSVALINAPVNLLTQLESMADSISLKRGIKGKSDHLFLFVMNKTELETKLAMSEKSVKENGMLWVCYQKKSSKVKSDIDRDSVWNILSKSKFRQITLISIDDSWTAFGLRNEKAHPKKSVAVSQNPIDEEYIDKVNRIVRCPPDLDRSLSKNKDAKRFFDTLSFTNKKEYLIWILLSKKNETRKVRIEKTIKLLSGGIKNPSGG
ncbi:MAG: YdeI/OmpD-associated family protein [Melioribacteraceae bacterium]